jgi:RNA polymerase sigma-70 factor (ECF subfamily)
LKIEKVLLEDLYSGREEVYIEIYRKYRDSFIRWTARNYSSDSDTASDCFQDAVIILLNNVKSGKLTRLDSDLKTYLFSVGKNILLKKYSLRKHETGLEEVLGENISIDAEWKGGVTGPGDSDEQQDRKQRLIDKIAELAVTMNEPCRSILKHYYYENLSMEKIAEIMNYKNADTVKSQKVRCMKYLENSLDKLMS